MKRLASVMIAALIAGCASPKQDPNYLAYLQTMQTIQTTEQRPLVELKALPGQAITGLASFTVYAPQSNSPTNLAVPTAQQDPWANVLQTAIGAAAQVAGGAVIGSAVKAGFGAIKDAGTAGYAHVQAPQANVTTTNTSVSNVTRDSGNTTTTRNITANSATTSNTATTTTSNTTNTPTTNTSNNTSTSTTTNSNNPITTTTTNPVTGR